MMALILVAATLLTSTPVIRAVPQPDEDFCVDCCSLYCAASPEVTVSRHLGPQDRVRYDASRLEDGLATTAWVTEGGEGEWFQFVFPESRDGEPVSPRLRATALYILTGYGKTPTHRREHARPHEIHLLVNDVAYGRIVLRDDPRPQRVALPEFPVRGLKLKFVIRTVYPGTRFRETAVSEVRVDGVGHH